MQRIKVQRKIRSLRFDPAPVRSMLREWWDELPNKFPNLDASELI